MEFCATGLPEPPENIIATDFLPEASMIQLIMKKMKLPIAMFLVLFFGDFVESFASSGPMHSRKGKMFYKWDRKKAAHFGIGFRKQGEESGCKLWKTISNESYWFFEAQHQIVGDMYGTFVRSAKEPVYCYLFKPRIIEKIKDEAAYNHDLKYETLIKTFGYLDAIEKWIYERNIDQQPKGWPSGKTIRVRIQELTGKLFNSLHDLRLWFKESERYLIWSEEKKRLVFDESRKQNNQPYPVRQYEKVPNNPKDTKGFLAVHFKIVQMHHWRTDDNWYLVTYHFPMSRPNAVGIMLPIATIIKYKKFIEQDFKKSLAERIEWLKKFKSQAEFERSGKMSNYLPPLWELTGLNFLETKQWIDWYEENKDKLVLSDDFERLIVLEK